MQALRVSSKRLIVRQFHLHYFQTNSIYAPMAHVPSNDAIDCQAKIFMMQTMQTNNEYDTTHLHSAVYFLDCGIH